MGGNLKMEDQHWYYIRNQWR